MQFSTFSVQLKYFEQISALPEKATEWRWKRPEYRF